MYGSRGELITLTSCHLERRQAESSKIERDEREEAPGLFL
jgi:hypothetical protein